MRLFVFAMPSQLDAFGRSLASRDWLDSPNPETMAAIQVLTGKRPDRWLQDQLFMADQLSARELSELRKGGAKLPYNLAEIDQDFLHLWLLGGLEGEEAKELVGFLRHTATFAPIN